MNNKKYANLLNKIKMKGHMAKAVALTMCFVLFTTSVDITALAYTGDAGSDKEIVGISSLSDAITNQKVNIDATLEDIKLPESLDVHVSYQVEKEIEVEVEEEKATPTPTPSVEPTPSAEPTPSVEVKPTEESNQPDDTQNENPESQVDGEQVAKITYGEYDSVETVYVPMTYYAAEPSKEEVVVETLEKSDVADISDDKKTESKTEITKETVIEKVEEDDTVSVTWAIDEENSSRAEFKDLVAGEKYIFVPTITEDGYKLADDVDLPVITVTVDENQAAFEKSVTVDGVVITVTADEGVFPEDATIEARKVTTNEEKEVEEAIDEIRDDAKNVALSYTFDITAYDKDGNEIEPDTSKGSVKVTFKMAEIANENLETDVYHVEETDDGLNAEGLAVTNMGANTDDANIDGTNTDGGDASGSTNDEITVETTGFSFYTVEFTYGELQYVLEGDERVELTTILDAVGIKENDEISKVEGSDDELFKPVFDEEENVWYIESLKAFNTEEWLKVTIDGIEYEIVVTDDQEVTTWADLQTALSGENGTITLGADIKAISSSATLEVSGTKTLDLNGHVINGTRDNSTSVGSVIKVPSGAFLTLNDGSTGKEGKITGGTGSYVIGHVEGIGGGGVLVNGSFTMTGGTIIGNSARYGGGVYVSDDAGFTMTGGTITGNTVFESGELGGEPAGDGVYFKAPGFSNFVTLGGTAKIIENSGSNLYLGEESAVQIRESDDNAPAQGMLVGVTTENGPCEGTPVTFATYALSTDAKYFFADNESYAVDLGYDEYVCGDGCLQLVVPQAEDYYPVWIGGTQISRFNKEDVLYDGGTVSFAPETNTLTLNGAEICTGAEHTTDDAIYCNLPADKTLTINLIGSNVIGKAPSAEWENFNIASGISSKEGAKLLLKGDEESSLTIYAGESGIKGSDISLGEEGENFEGKLKIYSLKTGIQAGEEPAEEPAEGEITIYGGDIDIESKENGLFATNPIKLSDVTLNVTANPDYGLYHAINAKGGLNITGSAFRIVARARLNPNLPFSAIFCPSVTNTEGTKAFGSTEWDAPEDSITSEAAFNGCSFKIGDDFAKAVILHICSVEQKSGQAATCTEDGWKDYYQCTNTSCNKIYASSSATGTSYADLAEWKASPEGKIERGHSWIYTASGAALTATCERNASHTATLTLTASDAVYSGSAVEATMDKAAWEAAGLTAPPIVYEAKTGSALTDDKAVNAGCYTACISKGTATASLDFSITKATSSVTTAPTANSLTYNGENQALVSAGAATGGDMNYAIGADASTAPTSGWSSTIPTGKNAGTYYVWYKSAGDVNHSDSTPGCITVNVAKKEVTVSGITATNRGYIKDDKTVTLVTTGATLTGKVDGDDLSVTATGEMADANAGENKSVTIKNLTLAGAGKDNYELASSGQQTSTTVTITKASHTVTAPTARNPVYNGNEQVLISAGSCTTGTIKYSLDGTDYYDSIDSIKKKEIGSYTVFYKVEGDGNYETYGPKSITAKIVKKSDPTPTPTPTPNPDPQPTKNPDPQPNPQPTITVTSSVQYAETGNPIKNYVANNHTGSNIPLPFITTDSSKAGWKAIDEALDAHKAKFKKMTVGTLSITMNGSTTVDTKLITDAHEKKIPLSFALDDEVAIGIPVANTVLSDQAKEGKATYFKVSSMTTAEAVGVKKAHAGLLPSDIVAIGGDANTPVVLTLCSNDKLSTKKSQLMTITFNANKAGYKKGDKVYLYCGTSQNGIAMYKSGKVDKNGFVTFSVPMVSNYWTIGSKNTKNKLLRNAVALPR